MLQRRFTSFISRALACLVLFCALAHPRPVDTQASKSLGSPTQTETPAKDHGLFLFRAKRQGLEHWGLIIKLIPDDASNGLVKGTLMEAGTDVQKPLKANQREWKGSHDNISIKLATLTKAESEKAIEILKTVHLTKLPTQVGGSCIDYVRLGAEALVKAGLMHRNTELDGLTNPEGTVYNNVRSAIWGPVVSGRRSSW